MSAALPLSSRVAAKVAPRALIEHEYRALDRAAPLAAVIPLCLLALTVCVLHAARAVSPWATPVDLGRRIYQVFFGLSHLAALLAAPLAGAWLAAPEHGATRRDLLSLAGVSAGALVRARLAATLGHLGSVALAAAPIAVVSFFYDGVLLRSVLLGMLSLLTCLTLGGLLGQSLGARASSPGAALARAALASLFIALCSWHFIGRALGQGVTASLHVGYHGASWWPELATNPSLDPGTRRTLLFAPLVLSITLGWLLHALAARASDAMPQPHTLQVRLAMIATSFVGADLAARLCAHTRHTRVAIANGASIGITALAALELVLLFVALGEPSRAAPTHGTSRRRALERWLGASSLSATWLVLVVAATQMAGLARHSVRLIKAISEGAPLAHWEPALVALLTFGYLVLAAGLGSLLKALLPRGGARVSLAAVLAALWLLPAPVRFILGGAECPWRVARWVMAFSPPRALAWIANFTHSPLTRAEFRLMNWRTLPEAVLTARVTAAEIAVGVLTLLAATALSRWQTKER